MPCKSRMHVPTEKSWQENWSSEVLDKVCVFGGGGTLEFKPPASRTLKSLINTREDTSAACINIHCP